MSSTNPEVEVQLDSLAKLCCDSIASNQAFSDDQVKELSKALLMSGFERQDGAPLSVQLETRVRDFCKEPAMHRGAEIKAVTESVQETYKNVVRWQTEQPSFDNDAAPKAANISSATDA
jgi:hypothetical protein